MKILFAFPDRKMPFYIFKENFARETFFLPWEQVKHGKSLKN